ncbi:MAG TPA: response regulator [Kouleothrix sp.]|uniref:response regulator n=1 Tax=Kouleothrix sp. TaxID=2779161 RepID=UPI002C182597|nr:response regulator [Kouleothrix sp.]
MLASEGALNLRHCIVADDDAAVRAVLCSVVSRTYGDPKVLGVENGQEALSAYQAGGADLIITDVEMPAIDGIALVRALRAQDARLPIVVMSGNIEAGSHALAAGANWFLPKPFAIRELTTVLGRLLAET